MDEMKIKITIRQLNGALAALKATRQIILLQKDLEHAIALMLEKKEYEVMLPKGKMVDIVLELNDLNEKLLSVQRRSR